jgi:hypothetical protein
MKETSEGIISFDIEGNLKWKSDKFRGFGIRKRE